VLSVKHSTLDNYERKTRSYLVVGVSLAQDVINPHVVGQVHECSDRVGSGVVFLVFVISLWSFNGTEYLLVEIAFASLDRRRCGQIGQDRFGLGLGRNHVVKNVMEDVEEFYHVT
jgi:hypothetical protein